MYLLKRFAFVAIIIAAMTSIGATSLWAFDSPGRYQMSTNLNGTIIVLDTITGQCWSKTIGGNWVDEGNPTEPQVEKEKEPIVLKLPAEMIELTIKQRRSRIIPGSEDRLRIYLDDITAQQVMVTISDDQGHRMMDEVSLEEGEIAAFKVNDKEFFVRITALRNVLLGTDLATLEIASNKAAFPILKEQDVKERTESDNKP